MAEGAVDVLMRVVLTGEAMPGESRTTFVGSETSDTLRRDFIPGRFCELQEFSFSAGVASALSKKDDDEEDEQDDEEEPAQGAARLRSSSVRTPSKAPETEFADMQPVQFTRILDASSTLLFKALVGCDTLESISVVKRKAAGTSDSGQCYLRLDFLKVLMTNLEWQDAGHVMTETGTFIYREVKISYRPQKADGSLGTVIQSRWKMKAAAG